MDSVKMNGVNRVGDFFAGVIRAALITGALVSFAAPACDGGDADGWVADNGDSTNGGDGGGSMSPATDAPYPAGGDDDDNSSLDGGNAGGTGGFGGTTGGDYSGADDDDDDSTQATGNTTGGGEAADTGAGTDGSGDTTGTDATDTTDTTGTGDTDSLCLADPQTFFMSADESNSQAAPTLMRALVNGQTSFGYWGYGGMGRARPYEFLNYYDFAYPAPEKGLALYAEALETKPGEYAIQIGLRSENRTREEMRQSNITLVLDTSGSMGGEPIERVKDSCRAIVGSLKKNDVISIVTWNTQTSIPLDSRRVAGPNDGTALAACNGLGSDGGTDLDAGLRRGYDLAYRNYIAGAINRLVLMSDGGANVGQTNPALIAQKAGGADEEGVFLAGVGMGASYDDTLMNTVTDYGRGAYLFIDSKAEADRMFGERYAEVFDVAALNVRVSATLPPGVTIKKFYGEQISTNPAAVRPQHLAPNDQMVFFQTVGTCMEKEAFAKQSFTFRAEYTDPVTKKRATVSKTMTFGEMLSGLNVSIRKTQAAIPAIETLYKAVAGQVGYAQCSQAVTTLSTAMSTGGLTADSDLRDLKTTLNSACTRWR